MINGEDHQVSTTYGLNIMAITFLEPVIAYMPPTGLSNHVGENITKLQHNMKPFIRLYEMMINGVKTPSLYDLSSISARFKPYFGGCSRGMLPEVTSPEVISPEQEVMYPKVCSVHVQPVSALFSFYSSSTKSTIAHDRHGYRK
jgi:hypothetical protein